MVYPTDLVYLWIGLIQLNEDTSLLNRVAEGNVARDHMAALVGTFTLPLQVKKFKNLKTDEVYLLGSGEKNDMQNRVSCSCIPSDVFLGNNAEPCNFRNSLSGFISCEVLS